MIRVNIKLVGLFSTGRFKQKECSCLEGARVKDVIDELQIPLGLVGIYLINGIHADIDSPLKDGDSLVLLPLLDGG